MLDLMPEVKGMKAIDARPIIVEKLKELGALVSIEDYTHNVAKCERCKSTIEPKISEQWFVSMKKITEPAIEAVKSGKVRFVPQKYEKTYLNWVENIRDWCISRQLWWGHRIPAGWGPINEEEAIARIEAIEADIEQNGFIDEEDMIEHLKAKGLWLI